MYACVCVFVWCFFFVCTNSISPMITRLFFFSFCFRWCFSKSIASHRIAFHVRVIRMSIETTAIAFAIATATATATLHMQWIWVHLELCECAWKYFDRDWYLVNIWTSFNAKTLIERKKISIPYRSENHRNQTDSGFILMHAQISIPSSHTPFRIVV